MDAIDLSWRQYGGREWHCPAQVSEFVCVRMPALQRDVQLVPGPRLELLGCCMLRPVWAVVLILETRQLGLGEPVADWAHPTGSTKRQTSEERRACAVLWPSEDTYTCIHTTNKPNADGLRWLAGWLLREERGQSMGQGSISRQLITADSKKGDSGLKQGLLFPPLQTVK